MSIENAQSYITNLFDKTRLESAIAEHQAQVAAINEQQATLATSLKAEVSADDTKKVYVWDHERHGRLALVIDWNSPDDTTIVLETPETVPST